MGLIGIATEVLKRVAASLPRGTQQNLKRNRLSRAIRAARFSASEPEFERLGEWLSAGDWAIDVGANIGQYTIRMSHLVGPGGRVIAIEPIAETFELLASAVSIAECKNVTLLNVAASAEGSVVGMSVPSFPTGLTNYYRAQIVEGDSDAEVMGLSIDTLPLVKGVRLVKIDVEGHEFQVLRGMESLLRRDSPLLIVEGTDDDVRDFLASLGYEGMQTEGSPNSVFRRS